MPIKAIIFDLDNTLVDFMDMKHQAVRAAARAMVDHGLPGPVERVEERLYSVYERRGIEYQEVLDLFLEEELGAVDHRLLAAGIVAYRRAREASLVLYPHVKSTLTALLRRGYRLAVLSDAPARQAWLRLANLDLLHFFDQVITHEDTGKYKPAPEPFQHALDKLELGPAEVLMVGDWPARDIAGAAALGMRSALAVYGCEFDTGEHNADYVLHDIADLLLVLDKMGHDAG